MSPLSRPSSEAVRPPNKPSLTSASSSLVTSKPPSNWPPSLPSFCKKPPQPARSARKRMSRQTEAGGHVVEEVHVHSGGRRLHGRLAYPEEGLPVAGVVLAGPHPLLGGTMDNNVVAGVGDGLARRGLLSLRFDYAG